MRAYIFIRAEQTNLVISWHKSAANLLAEKGANFGLAALKFYESNGATKLSAEAKSQKRCGKKLRAEAGGVACVVTKVEY